MSEPIWLGHRDLCPTVSGRPCDCPCSHPDCPGVDRCQNPECPVVALFETAALAAAEDGETNEGGNDDPEA